MMKFTLGLAILAFTLIVGSYKFIENSELISARERGLREAITRRDETKSLRLRLQRIKQMGMPQGEDQKFAIERLLGIGAPGLEFNFIGQGRGNNATAIYRHTYRVDGASDFPGILKLLRSLTTLPGFTVYRICYACTSLPKDKGLPEHFRMVSIEGFLYVYDPAQAI